MDSLRIKPRTEKGADRGPYCAFKSDRIRLWALISRDIRLVLIAISIGVAPLVPWLPL